MTSDEMLIWIFDDNRKSQSYYRGIIKKPYLRQSTIEEQLTELANQGKLHDDKKIYKFLKAYGKEAAVDYVQSDLEKNNEVWSREVGTKIKATKSEVDVIMLRREIVEEAKKYEPITGSKLLDDIDNHKALLTAKGEADLNRLLRDVNQAKTLESLNRIDFSKLPDQQEQRKIRDEIADKTVEIEGTNEEQFLNNFSARVSSAAREETLNNLKTAAKSAAPTVDSEDIIVTLIDEKLKALKNERGE